MSTIQTQREEFHHFNILSVEAGTNCPQGGDSGAGGQTIFSLGDLGSTDWVVEVTDDRGNKHRIEFPRAVTFQLGGDAEAETLIQAPADTLKVQYGGKITTNLSFSAE